MKGLIGGGLVFLAFAALAILFVYPAIFGLVQGLFETSDLGTLIGIAVCALVTPVLFWVAALVSLFVGAFLNAGN